MFVRLLESFLSNVTTTLYKGVTKMLHPLKCSKTMVNPYRNNTKSI